MKKELNETALCPNHRQRQHPKEKEVPSSLPEAPDHVTRSDLPPLCPHKEILRPVAPPGHKTSLNYFIYTLVTATFLFAGLYTYVTFVGLKQRKDEVGWWGMTIERSGRRGQEVKGKFEEHLSELASVLGIHATHITLAIKPYAAPATLSSLAPRTTGEAMQVLFEEDHKRDQNSSESVMGSAAEGPGKVVRFDDPLEAGL
ncbi:hypothetical protein K503DRAFT_777029 [Rhizopogon vinicolor AM-OR11-026]|uniref:Uncharacterized protein n=1 Tax=Rhizopogon vinicolor AM-OR11-026 TaxID=1314800 RepID=A0A1B7MHI5_9AGAM|nr:hypothetical protein K503DRAFT_777029 [Rhizopogon vinicolor AM-OR11-026]